MTEIVLLVPSFEGGSYMSILLALSFGSVTQWFINDWSSLSDSPQDGGMWRTCTGGRGGPLPLTWVRW